MEASWRGCCPRIGTVTEPNSADDLPPHPPMAFKRTRMHLEQVFKLMNWKENKQTSSNKSVATTLAHSQPAAWITVAWSSITPHNSWSKVCFALMLAGFLGNYTPTHAQTGATQNNAIVQIDSIVKRHEIQLPKIYQERIDKFLADNKVMKDEDAKNYTAGFISKEMEADWWISKGNQFLFIWHSIYNQVTNQDLYDGKDNDSKISEDFNNRLVTIRIKACWQKYKNWITSYMNELSTEAQQRSAEYRQQSAEYRQQSAEALNSSLENIVWFYNRYKKDPNTIRDEEVKEWKEMGKGVIQRCIEMNIDYKAKLSNEMLKFYGVE